MAAKRTADADTDTKTVAAVERALDLLDAFSTHDKALSLAELSARTGLYKSTILRLAQTLELRGYLIRLPEGLYQIGARPFLLGALYQATVQPENLVMPILRELSTMTGESASYNVRQGRFRVCAYRSNSPQIVRDHMHPGDTRPIERGATGRILLAFSRPHSAAYADIRRRMLAHTSGEVETGMSAIGAPVFGADGEITGALALSGPSARFDKAAVPRMEGLLLAAAKRLTARMGGNVSAFDAGTGPRPKRVATTT